MFDAGKITLTDGAVNHIEIEGAGINFHCTAVDVYTGNDDAEQTDCIEVLPCSKNKGSLEVSRKLNRGKIGLPTRIRGEVGVRLFLESEHSGDVFCVDIAHHKGRIEIYTQQASELID